MVLQVCWNLFEITVSVLSPCLENSFFISDLSCYPSGRSSQNTSITLNHNIPNQLNFRHYAHVNTTATTILNYSQAFIQTYRGRGEGGHTLVWVFDLTLK